MTITVIVKHDTPDLQRSLYVETLSYGFHEGQPHVVSIQEIKPGEQQVFMVHDLRYLRVRVRRT